MFAISRKTWDLGVVELAKPVVKTGLLRNHHLPAETYDPAFVDSVHNDAAAAGFVITPAMIAAIIQAILAIISLFAGSVPVPTPTPAPVVKPT